MIVDCHTHIENSVGENVSEEHLATVETVDACIVLADSGVSSSEVNNNLAEYVNKYNQKMVGFAVVKPDEGTISTSSLESATRKIGLKGIVLYCSDWGIHPTNSRNMRVYESALELNLPVFFHNAGVDIKRKAFLDYAQPYLLDEVAREFPSLKFVIGNMGAPFIEQTLIMVAKHENVYADLTIKPKNVWQTYNTVIAAYEYGVMDKLLFGSGFPTYSPEQCIETLLGFNMQLADTNLPAVPRVSIKSIIERDTFSILGVNEEYTKPQVTEVQEDKDKDKDKDKEKDKKSKKSKKKD